METWRTLNPEGEANAKPFVDTTHVVAFGEKSQAIRDQWETYQEARKKTLRRDFPLMEAYEVTPGNYKVVNYRTFKQYNVSLHDLSCDCPDGYFTFADEGTNVLCKHVLYVAVSVDSKETTDGNQEAHRWPDDGDG